MDFSSGAHYCIFKLNIDSARYTAYALWMGEVIRNSVCEARLARSFTQEELADKVGVTRQTIIAIEKGNYTPSVLLALKLAACFTMPVEHLFCIRHEK